MRLTSKHINYTVATVDDLLLLVGEENATVIVIEQGRGGLFIYRGANSTINNKGTIFSGWTRDYSGAVNVKWFGAYNDGTHDSDTTLAFQNAFSLGNDIYIGKGTYNINDTITLKSHTIITCSGTVNWTGTSDKPLYSAIDKQNNIAITGGLYLGSPSAFCYLEGSTINPTDSADYVKNIKFDSVHVSRAKIFIDAQKAVRQLYIVNCNVYVENGINGYGKFLEIFISNSMIFGSSGAVDTYGIRSEKDANSEANKYPEGLMVTNSTVDNFDKSFELINVYVASVTNCFIGKTLNGTPPIYIKRGNSAHCREINFKGNTINGGILFDSSTAGVRYHASIVNNTFINAYDRSIAILTNSTEIQISNNIFESPLTADVAFACYIAEHCSNISFTNNKISSTYLRAFSSSGVSGSNIVVTNNQSTIANSVYSSRPMITKNNGIDGDMKFVHVEGQTVEKDDDFAETIHIVAGKGTVFMLNISIILTNDEQGYLKVILPAGLSTQGGEGWDSKYIDVPVISDATAVRMSMPLVATDDVLGDLGLKNHNCGTIDVSGYHNWISMTKV